MVAFGEADDAVEGRAELVRHRREDARLGAGRQLRRCYKILL